jgi:hypothetical protein
MKQGTKDQTENKSDDVKGKAKKKTMPLANKPDLDGRGAIRKSRWEGAKPSRST